MSTRKSVCLITGGYTDRNLRLQPWRYLSEVARQLAKQGHPVSVITDGGEGETTKAVDGETVDGETVDGLAIRRIPSINRYRWQSKYWPWHVGHSKYRPWHVGHSKYRPWHVGHSNQALRAAVEASNPAVILWHVGLPSFLHQRFDDWRLCGWPNVPVLGIFPGLIYRPNELLRLGVKRIVRGYKLSAIHVAGMLVPKQLVRHAVADGRLTGLVVQTKTTAQRLLACGLHPDQVKVIAPGVDDIWADTNLCISRGMSATPHVDRGMSATTQVDRGMTATLNGQCDMRQELNYTQQDKVVLFFGSPAPLRGLHTLIRALTLARRTDPSLKLLVLNRRHRDELLREDAELRQVLENSEIAPHVQVISGFLPPGELLQHVMATDIVALPFELVPADAPLSILEAQTLGKPIVTTRVASLPEMAAAGVSYLAEPADPVSLAQALLEAAVDLGRQQSDDNLAVARRPLDSLAVARAPLDSLAVASRPLDPPEQGKRMIRSWRKVGEEWSQLLQTL